MSFHRHGPTLLNINLPQRRFYTKMLQVKHISPQQAPI